MFPLHLRLLDPLQYGTCIALLSVALTAFIPMDSPAFAGICIGTALECEGGTDNDVGVPFVVPQNPPNPIPLKLEQVAPVHRGVTVLTPETDRGRIALVIGNSNYDNFPTLPNPVLDAKAIAEALRGVDFTVHQAINLRREEFDRALNNFIELSRLSEIVLVYYAGHGFEVEGENLLFLTDATILGASEEGVRLSDIIHLVTFSADTAIFMVDACRHNPLALKGVGLRAESQMSMVNTHVSYATRPNTLAYDGPKGFHSPYAQAVLANVSRPGVEISDFFKSVQKEVKAATGGKQVPWVESSWDGSEFYFSPLTADISPVISAEAMQLSVELASVVEDGPVLVNGERRVDAKADLLLLGPEGPDSVFRSGVNRLSQAGRSWITWYEERKLYLMRDPYLRSYALLVAVDNYGGTNGYFNDLGFMAKHADELALTLTSLGFDPGNIIKLYNADATRARIEYELSQFWEGGARADADRLVFYFGGHGSSLEIATSVGSRRATGFLAPFDFDPARPAASAVLMDDILRKQFRFIQANHVLAVIDSCSAGLALPEFLAGNEGAKERLKAVEKLARLRSETASPARDIIVAGTGEEAALYENGGVFTQALIAGLKGDADANADGLIGFGELAMYTRDEVIRRTETRGIRQRPDEYSEGADVIFVLPSR